MTIKSIKFNNIFLNSRNLLKSAYIYFEYIFKEVLNMAVNKVLSSTSLSIEVQSGTDAAGLPVFKKKSFSGIKLDAADQNIYDVAVAISGVINNTVRDYYVNNTSKLTNI